MLAEALVEHGLGGADAYTAFNNYLCELAEIDPQRAAQALRDLSELASRTLGAESRVAVLIAANAAAFTGMAGDVAGADRMYRAITQRALAALTDSDRGRIAANASHWRWNASNASATDEWGIGK